MNEDSKWIPVTEKLPEVQEDVLVTDEDGCVVIAFYNDWTMLEKGRIEWFSHGWRVFPSAWMPLPEPYRGDKQ